MGMNIPTLGASRKYTDETVLGGGAIKGKNCVVDSITKTGDTNTVKFKSTLDDGTVKTDTMTIKDGKDGADGKDGQKGADGEDGKTPNLDIDFTTGHLKYNYD